MVAMASQPSSMRRDRERELVRATRALFDERGMQDAPIEQIARAVGIARGLIYRHFSSKEELFVLTVTDYLDELEGLLREASSPELDAVAQLEAWARAYVGFCLRYPAFLDCALSLMHRPARDLREALSESVWLRLGQGIAGCVVQVSEILRLGAAEGTFTVEDPDYMANVLWTQILGAMHLARIRVGVRQAAPGIPALFAVEPETLAQTCIASALATVGAQRAGIAIRERRADDADAAPLLAAFAAELAEIYPGWHPGVGPRAEPDDFRAPGGAFVVAYRGGAPIACAGFKRLDDEFAEIKRLYVVPRERGRGVARAIVEWLEAAIARRGYAAIRLDTGSGQPHAAALYRSAGYREIADYNGNPAASHWFEKRLSD